MKNKIFYTANSGIKAYVDSSTFVYFYAHDYENLAEELKRFYKVFSNLYDNEISWNEGLSSEESEEAYLNFFANASFLKASSLKMRNKIEQLKAEWWC